MYALISPDELVYGYEGNVLGNRVAEVAQETFPVATPLFWTPCSNEVSADWFFWADGEILPVPPVTGTLPRKP
ncbi:hypothetical protein UFOVP732_5 [uncultured Caudovirales phage]|uniref:Uncharacterized protein n=1 Tax=uncultured Caudovirales phage TaxID=2100421 RepID=A0A6J5NMG4_9CAUD|nr:hypothetical protein UFOVP732_5 [uncultured Caudovirales phage]